ncbi:MAG: c-type cytochrome [Chloroflexi bacterium]|nr:c-type cytochrome [Chloroflexota bacterium]
MVRAIAVLAALVLFAVLPALARAHAELERSAPEAGSTIAAMPERIYLWYTEAVELRLTDLRLLDARGATVDRLSPRLVPGDTRALVADGLTVPEGTYVLAWRVTSAVDGHTTRGTIPFSVGVAGPEAALLARGAQQAYEPTTLAVAGKGALFAGALGLFGVLLFGPLVLGRWGRGRTEVDRAIDEARDSALGWIGVLGSILVLGGTTAMALAQAAAAAEVTPIQAIGDPLAQALVGTRAGYLLLIRSALGVTIALILATSRHESGSRVIALAMAGAILVTIALGSHGAAALVWPAVRIALDLLHLAAAGAWFGGLVTLLLMVRAVRRSGTVMASQIVAGVVTRFGRMVWVVGIVAATGIIQSLITVGSIEALERTPYGRALLLKLALSGVVALFGILHWRLVAPRLLGLARLSGQIAAAAVRRVERRFRWTGAVELVAAIAVLGLTGLLTGLQPAREAVVAFRSVAGQVAAGGLTMRLEIAPGEAGRNRTTLHVAGDLTGVEKAVLRIQHLDHRDMGETEITLQREGPDLFAHEGNQFATVGRWRIEPLVRRTGMEDARARIEVTILDALAARTRETAFAPRITTSAIVAGQLLLFGVVLLAGRGRIARGRRRAMPIVLGIAMVSIVGGGYLGASEASEQIRIATRGENPVAMDAAGWERARILYQQSCAQCHGLTGRGDGPAGRFLQPPPADLSAHAMDHPQRQLYGWITEGIAGFAMPAFREQIAEEDRWRLVALIRGFAENGPADARAAVAGLRP